MKWSFQKITLFPRGTLVALLRKACSFDPRWEKAYGGSWREFDAFFFAIRKSLIAAASFPCWTVRRADSSAGTRAVSRSRLKSATTAFVPTGRGGDSEHGRCGRRSVGSSLRGPGKFSSSPVRRCFRHNGCMSGPVSGGAAGNRLPDFPATASVTNIFPVDDGGTAFYFARQNSM